MEAKARSFTFLGNEGIVRVPFFQRGYVWTQENWEDILNDLSNSNSSHFLGSLILKQQTTLSGESKELLIIDGQQRLTTLSILLKALFDSFSIEKQDREVVENTTNGSSNGSGLVQDASGMPHESNGRWQLVSVKE